MLHVFKQQIDFTKKKTDFLFFLTTRFLRAAGFLLHDRQGIQHTQTKEGDSMRQGGGWRREHAFTVREETTRSCVTIYVGRRGEIEPSGALHLRATAI